MASREEVSKAISIVEDSRETHVEWRDWFKRHPNDPRSRTVGDAAFHDECVKAYDLVLSVLRSMLKGE